MEQEREEFNEQLDKDHDGLLDHAEIKQWLAPNERAFFEEEADHILTHVDQDEVRLDWTPLGNEVVLCSGRH